MVTFEHHPDGLILIRAADEIVYRADAVEFAAACDALSLPAYAGLPPGRRSRIYIRGQGHMEYDNDSQYAGRYPWRAAEAYIKAVERLRRFQEGVDDA